jgi:hypothetical protein
LVDSSEPVKVPDGAELFVGAGVLGAAGASWLGGAVVGVAFGAVFFFAFFVGDALAEASTDTIGDGGADADSPVGVLVAAAGVMPGTWVLNENSAARPATVPPRVRTARRIQPPDGKWLLGERPLP